MCEEACRELGWSRFVFDTRMENFAVHERSKSKTRKAKQATTAAPVGDDRGGGGEKREVSKRGPKSTFRRGDEVSIVDGAGEPLAHGHVVHGEPDMDPWVGVENFVDLYLDSEYWVQVSITAIVRGCSDFCLGSGHVLHPDSGDKGDGSILPDDANLEDIMAEYQGEVVVFQQWLVPKQRGLCKKSKKRKKA